MEVVMVKFKKSVIKLALWSLLSVLAYPTAQGAMAAARRTAVRAGIAWRSAVSQARGLWQSADCFKPVMSYIAANPAWSRSSVINQSAIAPAGRYLSTSTTAIDSNALLIQVIQSGSKEKLYDLIKRGLVDLNARYADDDDTILHIAAESSVTLEILAILLEAGANVNAKNKNQSTPLHVAVHYNQLEKVKLLVAHGANPNAQDNTRISNTDMKKSFLQKLTGASEFRGRCPLYLAQEDNRPLAETREIIKFLEPLTDESLWFVITPEIALHRAILVGNLELVKALLAKNIFSQQVLNEALMTACREIRNFEVMKLLIAAGADVNAKNFFKETSLHESAYYGNLAGVELLLKHGANPNVKDYQDRTPLDRAKSDPFPIRDTSKIIRILEGLTTKSTDSSDQIHRPLNPAEETKLLNKAIYSNNLISLQQLLTKYVFSQSALNEAFLEASRSYSDCRAPMLASLLDAGAQINMQCSLLKTTALHNAANYTNPAAVKLLLERGANPNLQDCQRRSALYRAQEKDVPSKETLVIISLLETVTERSLWFVVTPEIAFMRAVKGGNQEQIRAMLKGDEEDGIRSSASGPAARKAKVGTQAELFEAWEQIKNKKPAQEVLGVASKATAEEIKAAYFKWVRHHHPDRYVDSELNSMANDVLKYLNEKLDK